MTLKTTSTKNSEIGVLLKQLEKYPLLTPEQEIVETRKYYKYVQLFLLKESAIDDREWAELAGITLEELGKIKAEANSARETIILANIRLVVNISKKYQSQGLELIDLIQEGIIGLARALESFDPNKGWKFSTYTYYWIRQQITLAIREKGKMIRVPGWIAEHATKIKKTQGELVKENIKPTIENIADRSKISTTKVAEVIKANSVTVSSTDITVGKDEKTSLIDLIASEIYLQGEIEAKSNSELAHRLLETLRPIEQQVIKLKYGISEPKARSMAEIGDLLQITKDQATNIHRNGMGRIRKMCERNQVFENPLID